MYPGACHGMYARVGSQLAHLQRRLHQVEQVVRHLLAIHEQVGLEEPVPRVLRVGLRDVEELHVGGVPLQVGLEHGRVVLHVPLVERQPQLLHATPACPLTH